MSISFSPFFVTPKDMQFYKREWIVRLLLHSSLGHFEQTFVVGRYWDPSMHLILFAAPHASPIFATL